MCELREDFLPGVPGEVQVRHLTVNRTFGQDQMPVVQSGMRE